MNAQDKFKKSLLKLNFSPRRFAALLQRLDKLPLPKLPLKGRGYAREDFPLALNTEANRVLWEGIPSRHKDETATKTTGKNFRWWKVISPESAKACAAFFEAARATQRKRQDALWAKVEPKRAEQANHIPSNNEPRSQPCGSLSDCALSDAERDELRALLAEGQHPFTGRALELKHRSGLSWGQIANS